MLNTTCTRFLQHWVNTQSSRLRHATGQQLFHDITLIRYQQLSRSNMLVVNKLDKHETSIRNQQQSSDNMLVMRTSTFLNDSIRFDKYRHQTQQPKLSHLSPSCSWRLVVVVLFLRRRRMRCCQELGHQSLRWYVNFLDIRELHQCTSESCVADAAPTLCF